MMKYILPLIALGVTAAYAGDRETFDFGWKFKYFGSGDSGPAKASTVQGGNPASHAIDGNLNTRWCAKDEKPGHWIEVKTGFKDKIDRIVVTWENAQEKSAAIEYKSGKNSVKKTVKVTGDKTVVAVGGKSVSSFKVTVNGTRQGNWASIREIEFIGADGKPVKPREQRVGGKPESPGYKEAGFKSVQLPHDWAIESPFLKDEPNETGKLPWNGVGWYRKTFDVPSGFNAKTDRYYLDFDGVMSCPQVYVNGELAGEWAYGYASFRVDLTPFLKAGQPNVIAVQASNKERSTRWYPGAGIYRHVWLEKTGPVHLAQWGVYATTPEVSASKAVVRVQTTVDNTSSSPSTLTVKQSIGGASADPVEVTVAPGASETVTQEIVLPNPKLWSCESPHLYELKTAVYNGGKKIDDKVTNVGVRTIEWKSDGFYLNGKRVRLNGVCEHHDLGPLGAAFYERGFERKIEKLKEMGCNSIRTTHNPPAPEVLDLCDRHGMLVLDELFDIWKYQKYDKVNGYHKFWPQWWKKDVHNFVLRDRNHPCIIAWSGGNEIIEISKPDGPQISAGLRDEFRKYDTTRPYTVGVNYANGAWNGFAESMDVYGYNYKPSHYKAFAEKHQPGMPFYASETASCVASRGEYFFPVKWNIGGGVQGFHVSAYGLYAPGWAYCPDTEFTAQEASGKIAGEYVWTGFDYIGEPTPFNQDASNIGNFQGASEAEKQKAMKLLKEMGNKAPSRSSYFGIIDLAGFPKDTYYLYQSHWAPEVKQAHILPHWNWKGKRDGQVTPVMVFSSGDEAELFLNGKSQGVRKRGEGGTFNQAGVTISKNGYRFTWEDVKYEPGELKVVVKKDGKPWATATRVTTGATKSVTAKADRSTIVGDGRDLSYIEIATVDAKGNVMPTDCRKVSFSISGPAKLIGFCNGDPTDQRCMQSPNQLFFNGRILAVVRGERGKSGTATVTIRAEGLSPVTVPVTVKPATAEQLKK